MRFDYDYQRTLEWEKILDKLKSASFTYVKLNTYNPETHELVEKKDAKIKKIEYALTLANNHISSAKKDIEFSKQLIKIKLDEIIEKEKEVKKLEQELKELEG